MPWYAWYVVLGLVWAPLRFALAAYLMKSQSELQREIQRKYSGCAFVVVLFVWPIDVAFALIVGLYGFFRFLSARRAAYRMTRGSQ